MCDDWVKIYGGAQNASSAINDSVYGFANLPLERDGSYKEELYHNERGT